MGQYKTANAGGVEWPTLGLILMCYLMWYAALWWLPPWAAIPGLAVLIALHASLQHEAIHGHPFAAQWLNDLLVAAPLMLVIPYARFKATHLAHHSDVTLTDPYDDPETNFLAPDVWKRLPRPVQLFLTCNNTLVGRLALGPAIGQVMFVICEWRTRSTAVILGWAGYIPALVGVVAIIAISPLPFWAYGIGAYFGLSLLKLRTFLEHQAHSRASGRSVIIEDRGFFAFLFLNNNLHVVHHMHPKVAWYALPALYRSRRDHFLRRNDGYVYRSYARIIRQYFWRTKDPVAHPLWRK